MRGTVVDAVMSYPDSPSGMKDLLLRVQSAESPQLSVLSGGIASEEENFLSQLLYLHILLVTASIQRPINLVE